MQDAPHGTSCETIQECVIRFGKWSFSDTADPFHWEASRLFIHATHLFSHPSDTLVFICRGLSKEKNWETLELLKREVDEKVSKLTTDVFLQNMFTSMKPTLVDAYEDFIFQRNSHIFIPLLTLWKPKKTLHISFEIQKTHRTDVLCQEMVELCFGDKIEMNFWDCIQEELSKSLPIEDVSFLGDSTPVVMNYSSPTSLKVKCKLTKKYFVEILSVEEYLPQENKEEVLSHSKLEHKPRQSRRRK